MITSSSGSSAGRTHLMNKFCDYLKNAKEVVILSGAGISAESGLPTVRGPGAYWRHYSTSSLATPMAFKQMPGVVWEYYQYQRNMAAGAEPNAGHKAIVDYAKRHANDKKVTVLTQNVDGLHEKAGTRNLVELHGNLFKTRCTKCKDVLVNNNNPVCKALKNRGAPVIETEQPEIPVKALPHCSKLNCNGLLRPDIVWFGETLQEPVLKRAADSMKTCDVCLVVGTSSMVYPAAQYAPKAAHRGAIVAELNIESMPSTQDYHYYFQGPCGTTLPQILSD